ncbi:hypothetical protein CCDG5_1230 [[Clostridium] cellulosi]|uniref:Uncharacterized protein n=1 Tax=[Clostridium] cellulosi TaxID=29343 RepID=A0A078KTF1_9FIRM|nr:hypothetical protein CCDG5_1230 [[Clostridium] cellulosi]
MQKAVDTLYGCNNNTLYLNLNIEINMTVGQI